MRKMFSENQIKSIVNQGIESGDVKLVNINTIEFLKTFDTDKTSFILTDEEWDKIKNYNLFHIVVYDVITDNQIIGLIVKDKDNYIPQLDDSYEFVQCKNVTILSSTKEIDYAVGTTEVNVYLTPII